MDAVHEILLKLIRVSLGGVDESALSEGVDWGEVYRISIEQGVCAVCSDALKRVFDSQQTEPFANIETVFYSWIGQTMVQESECAGQWKAACELGKIWSDKGLMPVVLKGFSYARYYPIPGHRGCCDMDSFLFDKWEVGNRCVEDMGIAVSRGFYKNSSFTYEELFVENHRYCSPVRGGKRRKQYEHYLRGLLDQGPLSSIEGSALLSPPVMFDALFFMSHAQNHFINEGGIQLRHICDWICIRNKSNVTICNVQFVEICKRFGFWKFAYAVDEVADVVMGVKSYTMISEAGRRLLDEILRPTCCSVEFSKGWHTRLQLIKAMFQSRWKYELYSDSSFVVSLCGTVWAYLFEKEPKLSKDDF